MKKLICGMVVVLMAMFFVGCGSSDGNHDVAVPASAAEASSAYYAAPKMLESYFYEVQTLGKSSNASTVAVSSEAGTHLVINYKNTEIYNKIYGWGIYMSHGFMQDGAYVILLREYDTGSYSGTSRLFIDGKEKTLSLTFPINDVKSLGNGWLVLLCQNGNSRTGFINANWAMFNPSTGEVKQLGDLGTI